MDYAHACPCRRAADCTPVGKRHFVWQLAMGWKVMGDVAIQGRITFQFVARPLMWVVDGDWAFEAVTNCGNWPGKIGIATYQCKCVNVFFKCRVKQHLCRDVDIGTFFLKFDNGRHPVSVGAGKARLLIERHPHFVFRVKALHDSDAGQ